MALRRFQRRKSPKLNILKEGGDGGFKTIPKKEESSQIPISTARYFYIFLDTNEY